MIDEVKTTEHILERFKFAMEQAIARESLSVWYSDAIYDHIADDFVLRMKAFVYGEQLDVKIRRYPCDWWESVKERFARGWFLRRWPVRYHFFLVDAKALYETVSIPQYEPKLHIRVVEWDSEYSVR